MRPRAIQGGCQQRRGKSGTGHIFATSGLCSADMAAASTDPRPDLLEKWIDILPTLNSQWSAEWSPQKAGRDKFTWVAVYGLVGTPRAKFKQTISSQRLGYAISSCWPLDNGNSAGVIMHSHEDASRLRQSSPLTVQSPSPITVTTPFKQIQPIYAFELVILGISSYDPTIQSTLDNTLSTEAKTTVGQLHSSAAEPSGKLTRMAFLCATGKQRPILCSKRKWHESCSQDTTHQHGYTLLETCRVRNLRTEVKSVNN